ncbi:MAG: glutathione S-transferase family protein [Myxococcota bacterium]|nr:glutathione S-transferase family protein [Myxococcota bacterium]
MVQSSKEVLIYGVDHSPWVQTVAMALHMAGRPYRLVTGPLSWSQYAQFGYVMPQCRWPDGTVTADSFEILRELANRYPEAPCTGELNDDAQRALERLFLSYILDRTGGIKSMRFLVAWSKMPSGRGPGRFSITRAVMALYFYLLISGGRQIARKRGFEPSSLVGFEHHLETWSQRLAGQPFLGGDSPSCLDIALFGQLQCMATGLTDRCLDSVAKHTALSAWAQRMQAFIPGYAHDFTARLRARSQMPRRATAMDQCTFWGALLTLVVSGPLTVLLMADGYRRRSRNPHRTGRRRR